VRELLLCYTSKKVTSSLHKLTNYKSNYISTIYMKVNASLCMGVANQQEEDDMVIFILRFTWLLPS
jgi:HSP90 family molecular chaperone